MRLPQRHSRQASSASSKCWSSTSSRLSHSWVGRPPRPRGRRAADPEEAEEAARKAVQQGARSAVVTLGAAGAVLVQGESIHRMKAQRVEAVDTTGAGDAFVGALAAALAAGAALVEGAELAGA